MENSEIIENSADDSMLYGLIKKIAMSPEETKKMVALMKANVKKSNPSSTDKAINEHVANSIVKKYCRLSSLTGGATALTVVIPGITTVLAAAGGTTADVALTMKYQVDMCMCLAENYGYDITTVDAQNLSFLIAGGATIENFGSKGVAAIGSKAGVKMVQTYLKGTALTTIKEIFKKIGITFTRKALEKMIPFGIGVVVSSSANYFLTKYVGKQAIKWFNEDLKLREENKA